MVTTIIPTDSVGIFFYPIIPYHSHDDHQINNSEHNETPTGGTIPT